MSNYMLQIISEWRLELPSCKLLVSWKQSLQKWVYLYPVISARDQTHCNLPQQERLVLLIGLTGMSLLCFLPAITNRPGVAGAVLQTASSFTDWFSDPFPPNIVVYTTRLLRFNRCHLCHLRGVYLHGSHPTPVVNFFFNFILIFLYKVVELVSGGSFINEAYPV